MNRSWTIDAACRDVGSKLDYLLYPNEETLSKDDREEAQKSFISVYCRKCPVISECRKYGFEFESTSSFRCGVWGGMTEGERSAYANLMF